MIDVVNIYAYMTYTSPVTGKPVKMLFLVSCHQHDYSKNIILPKRKKKVFMKVYLVEFLARKIPCNRENKIYLNKV